MSLRSKLAKTCGTLIEKIKNKELISRANLSTIQDEIANFRSLNFLDDSAVELEIAKLETLITSNRNFKTDEVEIAALGEMLNVVLAKAENLSDVDAVTGKYFRKLKI